MAWYEAHQTLAKHPKTLKLASLINCERRYAVGLLHDLFTWGLDAANRDGLLPGLSAEEIASALDFSGKKGAKVVAALVESGYLEKTKDGKNGYKIHDWYDYAGKLVDQREADKRRKQESKAKKLHPEAPEKSDGNPTEIRRTERGNPTATVPYRTVPNNTRDSVCNARARACESDAPDDDSDRWEEFWSAYPRKSGGDIREACLEYTHVIDSGVSPETLISAAKALGARTDRDTFRYLPSAEKWLRNRGWEETVPDESTDKTNNIFLRIREEGKVNDTGGDH